MKLLLSLLFSLLSYIVFGQIDRSKEVDQFANVIEKNVFRLMLTVVGLFEEGAPLTFSYERQILKPVTAVLHVGPYLSRTTSLDDGRSFAINGYASAELRYYFNLFRRIRKEKVVRNFSASYLSIEHNFISNPLFVLNQSSADAAQSGSKTYMNVGRQRQFKQGYLNVFIGPSINVKELVDGFIVFDDFHIGISLGIVLFE